MAKKNKKQPSSSSSDGAAVVAAPAGASSAAVTGASTSTSAPLVGEAGEIERAFVLGNFSKVRQLAATASTDAGRATAARLMPTVRVEREQVMVGLFALLFITIAAVMALF